MNYLPYFWKIPQEHLHVNEPLAKYTSFKIGGPADLLITPTNLSQLTSAIKTAKEEDFRCMIIGGGNNILFSDKGFRGVIITTHKLINLAHEGNKLLAYCGTKLSDFSKYCMRHGLTGMEFACGIPGTVGGATFMNAGAYGSEMKNVVTEVIYLDENLVSRTNKIGQHDFSYRNSIYQKNNYTILVTYFQLKYAERKDIKATMDDLTCKREDKQPLDLPSAGSVFRRPEGHFVGKLIDDCKLRGYKIGGAQISTKHAGFIVNKGNASAQDVINLINHIKETVYNNFKVELQTEVRIIPEK